MTGTGEIGRAGFGVDRSEDGARAVGRGDSGGDAFARVDRLGEGSAEGGGVVGTHQGKAQVVAPFGCERQADESAAMSGHEVDDLGSDLFRRDGEVAFIFAVFVVNDDQDAAGANFFHSFGYRDEGHSSIVSGSTRGAT